MTETDAIENLTDDELASRIVDELSRDIWPPTGIPLSEVFLKRHERAMGIMERVCDLWFGAEDGDGENN
jgi:hypothetical protein